MNYKNRLLQKDIAELHETTRGRLIVITGARQCGKSTLAQKTFPDYPIISLDSPAERAV